MNVKYTAVLGCHLLCTAMFLKLCNMFFPFLGVSLCICVSPYILWIIISALTFELTKMKFLGEKVEPQNQAVFITGGDSGFGNSTAKRLDSKGFHVFATCLFPEGPGVAKLKESCSGRLHVLHMDVTKDDSVRQAVEYVKKNLGSSKLWSIVNNAGVSKGLSLDFSSVRDFQDCLDVNLLGPVRVIKAFLPLLKQTKGRIVNITSAGGEFALPFITPYISSKFGFVGLTECLKQELDMWGISVVSIEPELFKTGMTDSKFLDDYLDITFENLDSSGKDTYGKDYLKSLKEEKNFFISFSSSNISVVVDDIESAVTLVCPDSIYKPRRNTFMRVFVFCFEVIPKTWRNFIVQCILRIVFRKLKPKTYS